MDEHFHTIYDQHAEAYHTLVMAEDTEGNLLRTIQAHVSLASAKVVEAGAGTGRITKLLLDAGIASIVATEPAEAMRDVARRHLKDAGDRCSIVAGSVAQMPVPSATYDLAIAAWVVGHFADWYPDAWKKHVDEALTEMQRTLKPGGVLILIESLGTGRETPTPPSDIHAQYYTYLETVHGMKHTSIRTDYRFETVDEAIEAMGAFFGEAMCDQIRAGDLLQIPECTGFWSKQNQ